jgi:hypothetical protein
METRNPQNRSNTARREITRLEICISRQDSTKLSQNLQDFKWLDGEVTKLVLCPSNKLKKSKSYSGRRPNNAKYFWDTTLARFARVVICRETVSKNKLASSVTGLSQVTDLL